MTSNDHGGSVAGHSPQPELHQRAIRQLTRAAFDLAAASNLATDDDIAEHLSTAVSTIDQAIRDLRRSAFRNITAGREAGTTDLDTAHGERRINNRQSSMRDPGPGDL
ncbi:hypothetical protein [Microlunatus sp. GCM10028923]|uniref:hypothetical protein n=1 Tax=Microlunatus sp. GCM10028923 TaxID=3273400 RepID=UPI003619492C